MPQENVKIPQRYKLRDVNYIIRNLGKKTALQLAEKYGYAISTFQTHLTSMRKAGYKIPTTNPNRGCKYMEALVKKEKVVKQSKKVAPKRAPKKEVKRLPDRQVDFSEKKWVRIDRRTLVLVSKDLDEATAIAEYYEKRERMKAFNQERA